MSATRQCLKQPKKTTGIIYVLRNVYCYLFCRVETLGTKTGVEVSALIAAKCGICHPTFVLVVKIAKPHVLDVVCAFSSIAAIADAPRVGQRIALCERPAGAAQRSWKQRERADDAPVRQGGLRPPPALWGKLDSGTVSQRAQRSTAWTIGPNARPKG